MLVILAVVILVLMVAGFPAVGVAPQGWGYGPSGLGLIVLLVVIFLIFRGRGGL